MTKQQLLIITAFVFIMFISLYSAASTNSQRVYVSDLDYKAENHEEEIGGLKTEVSDLKNRIDALEEELKQLRWRR